MPIVTHCFAVHLTFHRFKGVANLARGNTDHNLLTAETILPQ